MVQNGKTAVDWCKEQTKPAVYKGNSCGAKGERGKTADCCTQEELLWRKWGELDDFLVVQRGEVCVGNSCGATRRKTAAVCGVGNTCVKMAKGERTGGILAVQRGKIAVHRWDSCSANE